MNLLITRHDKIGDFIVTLPLFKAIKEQYPTVCVTALVSKINYDFAQKIDFIDDVILYDANNFWQTLSRIREKKFDASISGFIDTRLGWLLFLSQIKKRIAPATKIAQIFFNNKVLQRRSKVEKTEWQYNLDLAKKLFSDITLDFSRPLINIQSQRENIVIFHTGFGGSSDGNLSLDDYLRLAKKASLSSNVVFSFGPDDKVAKEYIKSNLNFQAQIRDDFKSIYDFMLYIATAKLFVSTSTGPMHLAGATNTQTLSFFGDKLFASSARWASVSDTKKQHNFMVSANYDEVFYRSVEDTMSFILNDTNDME